MTKDEFRRWRTDAGLSIRQAAAVLGVTPTCICNWQAGRRKVPQWVPRLIGMLRLDLPGIGRNMPI